MTPQQYGAIIIVALSTTVAFGSTPAEYTQDAVNAAALLPSESLPYVRFVAVTSPDDIPIVDWVMNQAAATSPVPVRAVVSGSVAYYDVRAVCPLRIIDDQIDHTSAANFLSEWEKFVEDEPYFTSQVFVQTEATFDQNGNQQTTIARGQSPHLAPDLQGHRNDPLSIVDPFGRESIIFPLADAQGELTAAGSLAATCLTGVPIVRSDWLIRKLTSTLEGGRYYEFRGIKPSTEDGVSDLDAFLQQFTGIPVFDISAKLDSQNRTAILRSKVTGKARAVVFVQGPQSKVGVNQGLISLTYDTVSDNTDPLADPIRSLASPKWDAGEIFVETPFGGGSIAYGLFSGDKNGDGRFDPASGEGELQRSAPDNVVADHTIPSPHPRRLQPMISCVRCHTDQPGLELWQPIGNDVKSLLRNGVVIFGDKSADAATLQGMYQWDDKSMFFRAREDIARSTSLVTGLFDDEFNLVVRQVGQGVSRIYHQYWYDLVTPEIAAAECGFENVEDWSARIVAIPDPIVQSLRIGLPVNRQQWEIIFADVMFATSEVAEND